MTAVPAGRMRVDPVACDGRGLCAEILPERIALDEWGYPLLSGEPLTSSLVPAARQAVAACPLLALRVDAGR
jgi:ferredoxin